jgi:hypothetical protein
MGHPLEEVESQGTGHEQHVERVPHGSFHARSLAQRRRSRKGSAAPAPLTWPGTYAVTAQDATHVGRLLAASGTADIVDAHVVVCANRAGQRVVTSGPTTWRG